MSVLLALLLSVSTPSPSPSRTEMRGLWVVRTGLVSPQAVDQVVDQAAAAGFSAIFVQVRGRGDAFYDSRLVPRSGLIDPQAIAFDPLGRLIERARLRGLEVHAWVNVLLTANFGTGLPAVLTQHPEWVMIPKNAAAAALNAPPSTWTTLVGRASRGLPDVEGYYLAPAAPGVRDHLENVVRELVRNYPVDGLHFDFIRFPSPDFDFSRPALEGFREATRGGSLLIAPLTQPKAWNDYRRAVVTALVEQLAQAARAQRPAIVVSAAVVPDEALAFGHKFQNWPEWADRGIVDRVCPMAYTTDNRLFRYQIARACERAGAQRVWAGIGAYKLTIDGVVEKVRLAREAGAAGVLVFSHEFLQAGNLSRLREAAFPGPATVPALVPLTNLGSR